ncbi:MAG TPA: MBL fold metallo-hydrolase [Blastocatellia bacterium]|nr:MBL fold metallo-hydrolase [Blastocatellia bacterium]
MNPLPRVICMSIALLLWSATARAQMPENPQDLLRNGDRAIKVNDSIYLVQGFGNTFLVTTPEGNVVIDTSNATHARTHKKLLEAINSGPIKYIILTHGHQDHTGGIPLWKQPGTQIIAQRNHVEFVNYQKRLERFFALRNSAQFGFPEPQVGAWPGNYAAKIEPTILFDDKYEFTLGGLTFVILHTPGETPDHLSVWVPQLKAAFTGDNYYASFPNIYTLRGTPPRLALDYVNSLDRVLALKPDLVLPSHGPPIVGGQEVARRLKQMRDAILYVHDETVKGMNAGKDVFTLMREIKLPPELALGESYGKVSWSVRGIYEGYAGWFDLNTATMYEQPASAVYADVVRLAGGTDAIVKLATERLQAGQTVEALRLTDFALAADGAQPQALAMRLKALEALRDRCRNTNERGWLDYAIRTTRAKMAEKH